MCIDMHLNACIYVHTVCCKKEKFTSYASEILFSFMLTRQTSKRGLIFDTENRVQRHKKSLADAVSQRLKNSKTSLV